MFEAFYGSWSDQEVADRREFLGRYHSLVLSGPLLTDSGTRYLEKCVNLKELHLLDTAITDAGLASIAKISTLDWLVIDNARVTARGLRRLAALDRLQGLQIIGVDMGNEECISAISRLRDLEYLEASGDKFGGKCLSMVAEIPSLQYLRMASPLTDDYDFLKLSHSKSLRSVDFDCPLVSDTAREIVECRLPEAVVSPTFMGYGRDPGFNTSIICLELYERRQFEWAKEMVEYALRKSPGVAALYGARALINLQLDRTMAFREDLEAACELALKQGDRELFVLLSRYMRALQMSSTGAVRAMAAEEKPENLLLLKIEPRRRRRQPFVASDKRADIWWDPGQSHLSYQEKRWLQEQERRANLTDGRCANPGERGRRGSGTRYPEDILLERLRKNLPDDPNTSSASNPW